MLTYAAAGGLGDEAEAPLLLGLQHLHVNDDPSPNAQPLQQQQQQQQQQQRQQQQKAVAEVLPIEERMLTYADVC
jgi:hypothetical protein